MKDGDRQAMRRLYDRYVGYATATGLRYVPDYSDVEDVVQDAFVRVFTSLDSFRYRGEGSLRGWICRIVANCALSFLKRRHSLVTVEETSVCDDLADDDPEVDRISPDVLLKLIGRLPVGYRTVLNLYVFEGLSHKEIARQLGIRPDTSASQFLRAKRMLARMIHEEVKRRE